jgi:hypothetical protein
MNRQTLTAMLTLAIVSCLALADEPTTRPAGGAGTAATKDAAASAPASEPAEEEIDLPPYYQVMVRETDMPEVQQKKLAAEVKKRTAAVEAWQKTNGEQRKSLQAELVAAYKEHDKDNIALLKTQLAEMDRDRKAMEKTLDAQIEAVLTEKQRLAWEGYLLYDKVITPFLDLRLDDSQQLRARNICTRALGRLLKAKDDKVEADKIYDELNQSIRERVLTTAQRAKLDQKPATAPATAPAEAPAAK